MLKESKYQAILETLQKREEVRFKLDLRPKFTMMMNVYGFRSHLDSKYYFRVAEIKYSGFGEVWV